MIRAMLSHFGLCCRFCGGLGRLSKSTSYLIYQFEYYYHDSCLKDVLNNPERYGHELADLAIEIYECNEMLKKKHEASFDACKDRARHL